MAKFMLCVTLVLGFLQSIHAYMIDGDCGSDTQFVQQKIDSAFRLISRSVTELERTPIDPDVDNFFNELFGDRASQNPNSQILRRFKQLDQLSHRDDNDQTASTGAGNGLTDVRFYCTWERIEEQKDQNGVKKYFNKHRTDGNGNMLAYSDQELESKIAHCRDVPPTLAITLTWDGHHSEIQICPWFLVAQRGLQFSDLTSWAKQPVIGGLSRLVMPAVAAIWYTKLDAAVLMDKVLLHELTHTTQAFPSTLDVGEKPYGFKNAQKLAQKWVAGGRLSAGNPMGNADSNALFAVGSYIITETSTPINPDGSFAKPRNPPRARARSRTRRVSANHTSDHVRSYAMVYYRGLFSSFMDRIGDGKFA